MTIGCRGMYDILGKCNQNLSWLDLVPWYARYSDRKHLLCPITWRSHIRLVHCRSRWMPLQPRCNRQSRDGRSRLCAAWVWVLNWASGPKSVGRNWMVDFGSFGSRELKSCCKGNSEQIDSRRSWKAEASHARSWRVIHRYFTLSDLQTPS